MTSLQSDDLTGYLSDTPLVVAPVLPPPDRTFSTSVLLSGLPKVDSSRSSKLEGAVKKLLAKVDLTIDEAVAPFEMPFDKDGALTLGFAFVNFGKSSDATKAVELLNGYQLDKSHVVSVTPYDELRRVSAVSSTYDSAPAQYVEPVDTSSYLTDDGQRDQFAVRHGTDTKVYWTDGLRDPVLDYGGEREKASGVVWCSNYMHWSPRGTYMLTIIPNKGCIIWGGSKYDKIQRFPHQGVQTAVFSPAEGFILTNSYDVESKEAVKIFDVKTGKLLRAFKLYPDNRYADGKFVEGGRAGANGGAVTPAQEIAQMAPKFQWSFDDKYVARQGSSVACVNGSEPADDLIAIYELPLPGATSSDSTLKLLDKRSLSTDGIFEFQWSPRRNVLAYWAPEKGNAPAHVDVVEIPSRKQLRQKNLFNVTKCSMNWQPDGDFLGVKVIRHTKSKKTLFNNFELFRVNEPGVPVEMLELKDAVMAFGWEPNGSRFAVVHAENISSTRTSVSFYDMNKTIEPTTVKGKKTPASVALELNHVTTLQDRQCNQVYWNPMGGIIVLAGLGETASGTLEFYDVDAKETCATREHYRATDVSWDPSGRTLATCVVQPIQGAYFKFQMDNGYMLWSFQGKQLQQLSIENFYQFAWRPRPTLLSKEDKAEVVRNLKKYEKKFDKADKERARLLYLEETKEKRLSRADFRNRLASLMDFYYSQKPGRVQLNGGYDSDDERNYVFEKKNNERVERVVEEKIIDSWPDR